MIRLGRVFKNKHQAVSQGVRRFGKRSIGKAITPGAVFQHPVSAEGREINQRAFGGGSLPGTALRIDAISFCLSCHIFSVSDTW